MSNAEEQLREADGSKAFLAAYEQLCRTYGKRIECDAHTERLMIVSLDDAVPQYFTDIEIEGRE